VDATWIEITTPYLDRHNDYLQIYAKRDDGGFLLSDDGYIIQDLKQAGCSLESPKRQALLKLTLNGFGVHLVNGIFEVHASEENFSLRKHNLVQAMLAVNDLFYLAVPMVASLFYEDVVAWLELHDIRYTPSVKFTGKSGFDHLFDFVIPKSRARPERIIRAINRPSRETAEAMAFAWFDTREVRAPESKAFAFLNDSEHSISSAVMDALRSYEVTPVPWTEREGVKGELAA
jgi:hypothetical protein